MSGKLTHEDLEATSSLLGKKVSAGEIKQILLGEAKNQEDALQIYLESLDRQIIDMARGNPKLIKVMEILGLDPQNSEHIMLAVNTLREEVRDNNG